MSHVLECELEVKAVQSSVAHHMCELVDYTVLCRVDSTHSIGRSLKGSLEQLTTLINEYSS